MIALHPTPLKICSAKPKYNAFDYKHYFVISQQGRACSARICRSCKPKNLPLQLMQANKAFIFPQFAGSLWKSRRLLSLMKTFAGMGFVL